MLLLLAFACATPASTSDDSSAPVDSAAADAPTWSADVSPIVGRSCTGCHHEGGLGNGDFTTYTAAKPMALAMASAVASGRMPPPAMDPACRAYEGSERLVLSDEEVATIQAWAEAGAPEGEPVAALVPPEIALEGADVEVTLPVAHTVEPDGDGNEYHCQILENPFTEPTYITGFDVLVDNPAVVHHTLLAVDMGGDAGSASGDSDLSDGWECRSPIAEDDWNILHAWAPGMEPTAFEDGGMLVNPGDQLVLQMHYYAPKSDVGTIDQSGYRFRTAPAVTHTIEMAPLGPTGFRIPAGETADAKKDYRNNYGVDVTVYGVFPHMHTLGAGYESTVTDGDTDTCLAQADAWDFGHQMTYLYDTPAVWKRGETLHTRCTYDNTTSGDVTYGEGTNEEMCFFLFYYGVD